MWKNVDVSSKKHLEATQCVSLTFSPVLSDRLDSHKQPNYVFKCVFKYFEYDFISVVETTKK